jgi:DcuC family C4-dicarboxylate transporter
MTLAVSMLVIVAAVVAIVRRAEVRLTLLLAGLALGALAGQADAVLRTFLRTLVSGQFVIPICCSMGFAYVLRQTGCDRHLVHLLVGPLRRVRPLLVPGAVLVGALVNVPVISQMSTAVIVGSVLVPLLRAAGLSPATTGSALLLGASIGGDLLNPGAPEVRTISEASAVPRTSAWEAHLLPLFLVQLLVSTSLFWVLSVRAEARQARENGDAAPAKDGEGSSPDFSVNPLKAAVPFVPVVLLFLTALPEPFRLLAVPHHWLVGVRDTVGQSEATVQAVFDSRLIGAAMLVGTALAALTDRRQMGRTGLVFFEGVGDAFTRILSIIVCASCFGEGVKLTGLAALLAHGLTAAPHLLFPAAEALPAAFAWLCGSGMASTQSLFGFFVGPSHEAGQDPLRVGAVVALSAAAGRTMSPFAAVTLACSSLAGPSPLALARRVALPLLAGLLAVLLTALALSAWG